MRNALKTFFHPGPFIGPQKRPKRWDAPKDEPQKLFTRDFLLLFFMAMCSNAYIAVYYCFEQWLDGLGITPQWRGVLLSALFAMILLFRPLSSVLLLRRGKLWPMLLSLLVMTLVMLCYPFVTQASAVRQIFALRIIQGVALAIFSSCTVAVLVECIPPGQSARGFAIFSLTMLLPYSIIPAFSESLIPLLGGEARLFAATAILAIPAFWMLALLRQRLKTPETTLPLANSQNKRKFWHALLHSGLGFVFLACLAFSITTIMAIFFMKGLCAITGEHPASFFSSYTITIILVRIFGSHYMDTLPRHRVTVFCSVILALCMFGLGYGPLWAFLPLACIYGLALGLLYPLLAAAIYDRSSPETRSVNSNIMMATFDASGMLAPLLGGTVIAAGFGYQGVFFAAALSVLCCGAAMLFDSLRLIIARREKTQK